MGKVHIYAEFFEYGAAREFMLRTLSIYDPLAYDTVLNISKVDDLYVVQGHRYASAD